LPVGRVSYTRSAERERRERVVKGSPIKKGKASPFDEMFDWFPIILIARLFFNAKRRRKNNVHLRNYCIIIANYQ